MNLLSELMKRDKMRGFCNELTKFNNTGVRMLDSVYHITLNLIKTRIFRVKTSRFNHLLRNVIKDVITKSVNH